MCFVDSDFSYKMIKINDIIYIIKFIIHHKNIN